MFTLLGTGLFFLFACADQEMQEAKEYDEMQDEPLETTRNATVKYSDSAEIRAIMEAPLIERYRRDRNMMVLDEGLNLTFFDPHPHETARVTANYGERLMEEKKTILRYDVLVVNEDNDTLETEYLLWDEEAEEISSDQTVKVTTSDEIIIGEGFESNPDFTEYTFYEITGTIDVEH